MHPWRERFSRWFTPIARRSPLSPNTISILALAQHTVGDAKGERGRFAEPRFELAFERLVHLAQEIKESLSTSPVVHVSKQDVLHDKAGEVVSYEAEIGLADYEKAVGDLVETTIACCERAVARTDAEIDGVAADADMSVGDVATAAAHCRMGGNPTGSATTAAESAAGIRQPSSASTAYVEKDVEDLLNQADRLDQQAEEQDQGRR